MTDAGCDAVLPETEPEEAYTPEVRATAKAYVEEAGGDARIALLHAVADGFAVTALVSRGFTRWGQPERRSRRD